MTRKKKIPEIPDKEIQYIYIYIYIYIKILIVLRLKKSDQVAQWLSTMC